LDSSLDDPNRREYGRRALSRMAQAAHGLRDAVVRSLPLVLRAAGELARERGEGQEVAAALLRAASRAADVPPDLAAVAASAAPPIDPLPPDQQALLRGELAARLLAAYAGRPEVQMELRPLTASREAARALPDPYRRARVLLRLLEAAPDGEGLLAE